MRRWTPTRRKAPGPSAGASTPTSSPSSSCTSSRERSVRSPARAHAGAAAEAPPKDCHLRPPPTASARPREPRSPRSPGPALFHTIVSAYCSCASRCPAPPARSAASFPSPPRSPAGLSRLAVTFFYKDELNLGPTEIGLLSAVGSAPWLVKPLWRARSPRRPVRCLCCAVAPRRRRRFLSHAFTPSDPPPPAAGGS